MTDIKTPLGREAFTGERKTNQALHSLLSGVQHPVSLQLNQTDLLIFRHIWNCERGA